MGKLENKVAIITGATSGIGEATAIMFAQEGAKVVVVGRSAERGEKVVAAIKAEGNEACFIPCDVREEQQIIDMVQKSVETYGQIDIVISNAGVFFVKPLEDTTAEEWDNLHATNDRGTFLVCKYTMPYLKETKGNIVITSSFAGLGVPNESYAYSTSKAALVNLGKCLAKTYGKYGIRVNTVCPGIINTPIWHGMNMDPACANFPIQRAGTADEIAHSILYLASDDAAYTTGAVLSVDGGQFLM